MNLPVKRFDFSSDVSSVARPSMLPTPAGAYCLYSEACSVLEQALELLASKSQQAPASPQDFTPAVTCGQIIPLDKSGIASTYCIQKLGHPGKCYEGQA